MNLTPEQLELLLYLLGALAIGFLFGYLLSKVFSRERYDSEIEDFSELLDTRDREIESASAKHGQLKEHMVVQANEIKMTNQKMQEEISKFENSSKLLNDEKIELESLLLKKDMYISELNEEIGFSKNELKDIQNLADDYKVANSVQDEQFLTARKEIEQNAKLNHALINKSEEQTVKVKALEEQKETLNTQMQMLTKSIHEKDNVIGELRKQSLSSNEVKLENQALKERLHNASKLLEESKVEVTKLEVKSIDTNRQNENFSTLQKTLEDTKKEVAQKNANIANLEESRAALEGQTKIIQTQQQTDSNALKKELSNIKADLVRKDQILKSTEEKLHLSQQESKKIHSKLQSNIANEQAISQLSGNESAKEGWEFTKIVKGVFGNGDKN